MKKVNNNYFTEAKLRQPSGKVKC